MSKRNSGLNVLWVPLGLIAFACTGCGGSVKNPRTYPVSGTVMYKGSPVEGATVQFWGEGAPRPASGVTNENGEFRLSMFKANDGALPGENKIVVMKDVPGASTVSQGPDFSLLNDPAKLAEQSRGVPNPIKPTKPLLPERYRTTLASPLKETVSDASPNEFVLQLTD